MTIAGPEALRTELERLVARVRVTGDGRLYWGEDPLDGNDGARPEGSATARVQRLQVRLYPLYCRQRPLDAHGRSGSLAPALSRANLGSERRDRARAGESLAWAGAVDAADRPPAAGARPFGGAPGRGPWTDGAHPAPPATRRHVPRESTSLQAGFYFAFSTEEPLTPEGESLVRLYWNVAPDGAPALVRGLTGRLNAYAVPFRLKCLERREFYARADAAVLYVPRRFFQITAALAAEVQRDVLPWLDRGVCLFTKRLGRGVGLAENPSGDVSFGTSRCRLVAEGVHAAAVAGAVSPSELVEGILSRFRDARLDPKRPWLNPGSVDGYSAPCGVEWVE